jgi:oligopeptide transport system substrate-binding protein
MSRAGRAIRLPALLAAALVSSAPAAAVEARTQAQGRAAAAETPSAAVRAPGAGSLRPSAQPSSRPERVLRRSSIGDPQTLDPQRWTYGQDGNLAQDLFQSLTAVDAAANTIPGQAESWSVSSDGLTYTFRLRPGLVWSDGKPIDSSDFLWSMRRLFDPRTAAPSAALLYVIRNAREVNTGAMALDRLGVRTPDARTVVIELVHPAPWFTEILVHRGFPAPRHVIEKHGDAWTRPGRFVSNGAFVLDEWRPGAHVRLRKNDRFHDARNVGLDAMYHIPIEDPKVALNRFRAGELDIAVSLPSEQLDLLKREFPRELHLVQQIGIEYYAFNTRRAPFDDVRVRRALSMAIEREVLTDKILRGGEPPAWGLVPPGVRDYPRRAQPDFAAWDAPRRQAEARRLLAQAGFDAARPLTVRLRYNNADTQKKIALAVAAMWQRLGVRTELITGDLRSHQQALAQGEFDVARAQWYSENSDAASFLELLDSRARALNVSRYSSAAFDRAMARSNATPDRDARSAAMFEAERIAMADQPIAPLHVYVSRRLISRRVTGWVDNARGVHVNRWLSVTATPPAR